MERKKNILERYAKYFLIIIFIVGIFGHLFEQTLGLMIKLTPFTLLVSSGVVFSSLLDKNNLKMFYTILFAYSFTLTIEIIGVKTGNIFGDYIYGETLGVKLFDVPLIIGLNWVFVILGLHLIASKNIEREVFIPFVTALLAVLFDYLLEPVAIKLNYWKWNENIIPLQNYIAWFVISFLLSLSFTKINIRTGSNLPQIYVIIQFIFFLSLNLFL